jgi:hypothetical protein
VVGAIAESYLCADARAWIAPFLEGSSLANAGVWADTIRDDPAWAHTRPWHFINVGDGEPMARAIRNPEGNVLTAIDRSERDLVNLRLAVERRAAALRFRGIARAGGAHLNAGDHGGGARAGNAGPSLPPRTTTHIYKE